MRVSVHQVGGPTTTIISNGLPQHLQQVQQQSVMAPQGGASLVVNSNSGLGTTSALHHGPVGRVYLLFWIKLDVLGLYYNCEILKTCALWNVCTHIKCYQ